MRKQLRPILAAVLAMVFPGLGHLLLRRWGRALLWHLTIVGGGVALLALYDVNVDSSLSAPTEAAEVAAALPTDVALPIVLLYGLSALDAYLVGRADVAEQDRADATAEAIRRHAADDESTGANAATGDEGEALQVACPRCGKETDADLDFCHWCTKPLPWADAE